MDAKTWENSIRPDEMLAALAELDEKVMDELRPRIEQYCRHVVDDVVMGYCAPRVQVEETAVQETREKTTARVLEAYKRKVSGEAIIAEKVAVAVEAALAVASRAEPVEKGLEKPLEEPVEKPVEAPVAGTMPGGGTDEEVAWAQQVGEAMQDYDLSGDLRTLCLSFWVEKPIAKFHAFANSLRMVLPEWPGR